MLIADSVLFILIFGLICICPPLYFVFNTAQHALLLADNAESDSMKGGHFESPGGQSSVCFPIEHSFNTTAARSATTIFKKYRPNMLRDVVVHRAECHKLSSHSQWKDVLFIIADSWKCIKSSTVTSSLYNDLRVGSHGDEKDTHTDQRVTTLIPGDCRQLGLGEIVKAEIDVWLNWHNDIGTEALSDDQIINIITAGKYRWCRRYVRRRHSLKSPLTTFPGMLLSLRWSRYR